MDSFFITVPLGLATKSFMVPPRMIRACFSPSALPCLPFSAAIADRRPFSAAIGAPAWESRRLRNKCLDNSFLLPACCRQLAVSPVLSNHFRRFIGFRYANFRETFIIIFMSSSSSSWTWAHLGAEDITVLDAAWKAFMADFRKLSRLVPIELRQSNICPICLEC